MVGPYTLTEIKLEMTRKELPPSWLAFRGLGDAMQATRGEEVSVVRDASFCSEWRLMRTLKTDQGDWNK